MQQQCVFRHWRPVLTSYTRASPKIVRESVFEKVLIVVSDSSPNVDLWSDILEDVAGAQSDFEEQGQRDLGGPSQDDLGRRPWKVSAERPWRAWPERPRRAWPGRRLRGWLGRPWRAWPRRPWRALPERFWEELRRSAFGGRGEDDLG